MSTLYIVFGQMGSGKTYCGQKLAEKLGVPFKDGDDFLPDYFVRKVKNFEPITASMIEVFIGQHLIPQTLLLLQNHDLVLSQALYMDLDRREILHHMKKAGHTVQFLMVKTPLFQNIRQLWRRRQGFFWILYWLMNKPFFQIPTHHYWRIENRSGDQTFISNKEETWFFTLSLAKKELPSNNASNGKFEAVRPYDSWATGSMK